MSIKFNSLLVKCFTSAFIYYVPQDIVLGSLLALKHRSKGTSVTGYVHGDTTTLEDVSHQLGIDSSHLKPLKKLAFTKYELV